MIVRVVSLRNCVVGDGSSAGSQSSSRSSTKGWNRFGGFVPAPRPWIGSSTDLDDMPWDHTRTKPNLGERWKLVCPILNVGCRYKHGPIQLIALFFLAPVGKRV